MRWGREVAGAGSWDVKHEVKKGEGVFVEQKGPRGVEKYKYGSLC